MSTCIIDFMPNKLYQLIMLCKADTVDVKYDEFCHFNRAPLAIYRVFI